MFNDNLKAYLREKVKRQFLTGKNPMIPKELDVERVVDRMIATDRNGIIGEIESFGKKSVSSPSGYADNFTAIKDNVEFLMGEVFNETNRIINQINDSTAERNSAVREMQKLGVVISEVENGRLTSDGLSYTTSDNFMDNDKIDLERSTVDVNLNAGSVSLSESRADRLQFNHYRSQNQVQMTLNEGLGFVKTQTQVPGTSFGGMFKSDDTERWEYVITTTEAERVVCYFTLKLSEMGKELDINQIILRFNTTFNNGTVKIEFLDNDKTSSGWRPIPGASSELGKSELDFNFLIPSTTHIRFMFTKDWPDVSETNEYRYGISEIIVKKAETVYESTFVTKSMELQGYQREHPAVASMSMVVDQKKLPGSNIKYFVGIDAPVAGKVIDADNNVVSIESDDAARFVPNGVNPNRNNENYYVYASQLRDMQHISGSLPFLNWQPKWQEIGPVNDRTSRVPTVRFFNTTAINPELHDIYYETPVYWGDIRYTGPWPTADSNVTWADDWDGTPQGAAQSGFIWGENPLSWAGVYWGDAVENPGWWRPNTPSASGMQLWDDEIKFCTPDYVVPVYDKDGSPVMDNDEPLQKHFWKVFKWPNGFLPVPGSIRLFHETINEDNETQNNKQHWKWNFRSKTNLTPYKLDFSIPEDAYYYTIKVEDIVESNDVQIINGTIRNLKFKKFSPSEVDDFFIDYGYDYYQDEDGVHKRDESDSEVKDAHATITFAEALASYRAVTGDNTPEMSVEFQYTGKDAEHTSWDTYLYVPSEVANGSTFGYVHDPEGGVRKVVVDRLDPHGIILDTDEILPNSHNDATIDKFPIPIGWSRLSVFTDIDLSQRDVINESSAKWNPDVTYMHNTGTEYISGTSNESTDNNIIKDTTVDFVASGIIVDWPVTIEAYADDDIKITTEGTITSVTPHELEVSFDSDDETYKIITWNIPFVEVNKGFKHSKDVRTAGAINAMSEVDIYTLMHETALDNDERFAILEDVDGSKYAVVKTPHHENFPKNMFNRIQYTRSFVGAGNIVTFTTGTEDNVPGGKHPISLPQNKRLPGETFDVDNRPPNTDTSQNYPHASTFGLEMQVNNPNASGFLFWDTAENLQTFYRIEYAISSNNRPSKRVMMMAKLLADKPGITPSINNYSLLINSREDIRRQL